MHYLFLDESGDHSLDKIDPQYPVFVLGGVLVRAEEYARMETEWTQLKRALFGRDDVILHTADMTRNKNGFERMKEPEFRAEVIRRVTAAMRNSSFISIGCAIKKDEHLTKYGVAALDPYHLSLDVVLERAYFAMGRQGRLHVVAESRNPTLDHALEIAFLQTKIQGTRFVKAVELQTIGAELRIRPKSQNILGLQLADLVVSPMGRFVLGKRQKPDWQTVEEKLYRYRGKWVGAGLVVLPK